MENSQEKLLSKKEQEQDFFENKIEVLIVPKEEFLSIMKAQNPDTPDEEILQAKGWNFDSEGKTIVLMRNDIFPEEYMPYLEIHEKWEAYVARKDGYNLWKKSVREYKNDKDISEFDDQSRKEFYGELSVYNYEFRHEYAIYKEYQEALKDGKLEEYHNWILKLRESEKPEANEETKEMIENDTRIRQSIYDKLTEGTKHIFTRKD
jgi:hypothetical protein